MIRKELYNYIKNNMFIDNHWLTKKHKHIELDLNKYQKEGTTFHEKLYLFYNNLTIPICPICKNKIKFVKLSIGYRRYCSVKCSSNSKEKLNKTKNTIRKKYGVDYITQTDFHKKLVKLNYYDKLKNHNFKQEILLKRKNTCLKRYGVENVAQTEEVKNKIKNTLIDRYDVISPFQIDNGIENLRKIQYKKYYDNLNQQLKGLIKPLFSLDEYNGHNKIYKWKCIKCGNIFNARIYSGETPRCKNCFPNKIGKIVSEYEHELVEWLNSIGIKNIIINDRTLIWPLELDIYIPSHSLAIEFNGLYWHSESMGKDKNYHLNKTIKCKNKEIELIHIFEDEWVNKNDFIKKVILHKLHLINIDKNIFIKNDVLIDDLRFNLFSGELIETIVPQFYYTEHHYRTSIKDDKVFDKIWDCGKNIYKIQ